MYIKVCFITKHLQFRDMSYSTCPILFELRMIFKNESHAKRCFIQRHISFWDPYNFKILDFTCPICKLHSLV